MRSKIEKDINKIFKIFSKYSNYHIDQIIDGVDKLFEMRAIAEKIKTEIDAGIENKPDDIDKITLNLEKEGKK